MYAIRCILTQKLLEDHYWPEGSSAPRIFPSREAAERTLLKHVRQRKHNSGGYNTASFDFIQGRSLKLAKPQDYDVVRVKVHVIG